LLKSSFSSFLLFFRTGDVHILDVNIGESFLETLGDGAADNRCIAIGRDDKLISLARIIHAPRSKPRRVRTQECKVTTPGVVLGGGLRFSSTVAELIKSADLLKVQAHWPRPERLVPRTQSRK
jgi:hypothetical protein